MLNSIPVIPKPQQIIESGGYFILSPESGVAFDEHSEKSAEYLCEYTGLKADSKGSVRFVHDNKIKNPEGYELTIDNGSITLAASGEQGFFYCVQTLRQLLPVKMESGSVDDMIKLPCLIIKDSPRFTYRGFMLDCARHFFTIGTIKTLLDLMSMHKLNRFHWHLTDDQGWRIEIKKYPKLTEIGSIRKESQIGGRMLWGDKIYDGMPHSGFYTQDEIREIVGYAKSLHIEVMPEIDMPGHFNAALAAYPEYSCTGGPFEVGTKWGIYKDILCAGKGSSYDFIQDILNEMLPLFPFKHIHIGGDEAPKDRWKKCPDCQALMEKRGIKNEKMLQTHFSNKIIAFMKSRGFTVIGWDEIVSDELEKEAIVQYWSPFGQDRAVGSLDAGRRCIFSPFRKYYLDYSYDFMPLRKTYEFDPFLKELTEEARSKIMGVEAPLWTEYVDTEERLYWQTFPRLSAVSETAWTEAGLRYYDDFLARFWQFQKRLDLFGISYTTWDCYSYDGRPKS
ncbi:MAG: beta-N-acetylhexosaminidase [Clostridia bacterium]|nr:beta-N-acetylhexosaminidase [Clostridia bacterium]